MSNTVRPVSTSGYSKVSQTRPHSRAALAYSIVADGYMTTCATSPVCNIFVMDFGNHVRKDWMIEFALIAQLELLKAIQLSS